MKKIFTLLALALTFGSVVQAQTQFSVAIQEPVANANLVYGTPFNQLAVVTVTSGSVSPTDTLAWIDPATPANNVNFRFVDVTKNMGDTIHITRTGLTFTSGSGTLDYCVRSFVLFGGTFAPTFDTTGGTWGTCTSVNVSFAAGLGKYGDLKVVEGGATQKVQLGISPNPAVSDVVSFDFQAQNTSDVNAVVYDLTGRKVMTHNYGRATKGKEGYTLDISHLNTGIYIVELTQDNIRATGRMVK